MLIPFAASELADLDSALQFAEFDARAQADDLIGQSLRKCAAIQIDRARTYADCRAMIAGKIAAHDAARAALQAAE